MAILGTERHAAAAYHGVNRTQRRERRADQQVAANQVGIRRDRAGQRRRRHLQPVHFPVAGNQLAHRVGSRAPA
jgi:hypothetical protein